MTPSIIGFEGVPSKRRTPLWAAPILMDEDRFRVIRFRRSFRRVSPVPFLESVPEATRLETRPYRGGSVLVVSRTDASVLQKHLDISKWDTWVVARSYRAFLLPASQRIKVARFLRDRTLQQVATILASGSKRGLYDLGWKVVRCAAIPSDTYLGALIISRSSHPTMGSVFLSSYQLTIPPRTHAKYKKLAEDQLRRAVRRSRVV